MSFIVRRLIFYVVAAWVALTINFFIPRLVPGNAVESIMSKFPNLQPAAYRAIEAMLGVGHPGSIWHQYWAYLVDVSHLNFGTSSSEYPAQVSTLLGEALPWTIVLVGTATVIAFLVGTALGIAAGWRHGGGLDRVLPGLMFLQAIPYFFFALILLELFAVKVHVFPIGQGYGQGLIPGWHWDFISSAVYHSLLPALTIVLTSIAGWMLQMRNVMITTIGEDYVVAAQAKGLPNRRVVFTYAARNAILPQLQGFGLAIGFVVSGALVMEIVFSYPGIGLLLVNAVTSNDYALTQGDLPGDHLHCPARQPDRRLHHRVRRSPRPSPGGHAMTVAPAISTELTAVTQEAAQPGWWRRMPTKAKVGVVLFGLFVLTAIIGPLVTPYDPSYQNPSPGASMNAPSAAHLLGTTQSGQDVLSQLLVGIRLTLELGIIVGVVATALAVIVGVTAAFLGGFWDELLSLVTNVFLVIPALPLLIVLLGYFPNRGEAPTIIVLSPARLAVGGSGDAGPDPGHPQPRLRGRVPGDRGDELADHRLRDRPQRGEPDRGELREHRAVRHRGLCRPRLHRGRRPEQLEPGYHALLGPESAGTAARGLVVVRATGPGGGAHGHRPGAAEHGHRRARQPPPARREQCQQDRRALAQARGPHTRAERNLAAPQRVRRIPALVLTKFAGRPGRGG